MWKKIKALLIAGALLSALMISGNQEFCLTVSAADLQDNLNLTEESNIQIVSYDAENDRALAVIRASANGKVTGDGVRLRSNPSTSATILEKMYRGEYVWIQYLNSGWYYIQRIKTGTWGWVSSSYIQNI